MDELTREDTSPDRVVRLGMIADEFHCELSGCTCIRVPQFLGAANISEMTGSVTRLTLSFSARIDSMMSVEFSNSRQS
jgi:hypothetical protein